MNLPQKVKIGGIWYTICLVPHMQLEDNCTGKLLEMQTMIKLDESLSPDLMKATLIHEIVEAINAENEYKMPHRTIQGLSTQIYQVIADNPEMFKSD
jgi:hypothetical protein